MNTAPELDPAVRQLVETIYGRYHYDFRRYAPASLMRGVRTALRRLDFDTVGALEDAIVNDAHVFGALVRCLTVQVSDVFRDPSYFRAIRESVVPHLRTFPSFKIWVAGCSTGEEAYSFAILLAEEGLLDRALIYATDINAESLRAAEEGVYDVSRFAGFSQNYQLAGGKASLGDYYTADYAGAVFDRTLKKAIVFSDHSLATDTVFAEVELVSCRNVLIYFERDLQDRAIGIMHSSLGRRGFLGLGLRESLRFSAHAAAFSVFDQAQRIYRRL